MTYEQIKSAFISVLDRVYDLDGDTDWIEDDPSLDEVGLEDIFDDLDSDVYSNEFLFELEDEFGITFSTEDGDGIYTVSDFIKLIAEKVNGYSYDSIFKIAREGHYDDALDLLDKAADDGILEKDGYYHFFKGRFHIQMLTESEPDRMREDECVKLVKKEFNKAIKLDESLKPNCAYWYGCLYQAVGAPYDSRDWFILAMENDSEEQRESAEECFVEEEEELSGVWKDYTTLFDYQERKFIMPIRDEDIAGCVVDGIKTFRLSNIPGCIKFPMGHPVANELYIGHPFNPNYYVPYSSSEDIFFLDKIDEYIYLLQCLGAEEIRITWLKGKSVSEYGEYDRSLSADLGLGFFNGDGSGSQSHQYQQTWDTQAQREFVRKCDPIKYPFVPDGLIWYEEQPRWKRMKEARLEGNQLEYSESFSSTDTRFVSSTEIKGIKAAAERLWIKIEGDAESNASSQFKEHTETQWRVDVKFRSLRDFAKDSSLGNVTLRMNENEQDYLEMYGDYATAGEISELNRKMLNKYRSRLGISEERARELEESCSKPQLTEDEKEYLEMYKEYAADSEISERDRKMLNKMRDRMGISEERAKEIEKI